MSLLNSIPRASTHFPARISLSARGGRTIALCLLVVMGIMGLVISPAPALSAFRFVLFAAGIATYVITVSWINSPRRFALALDLFALLALGVTLLSLLGVQYMTYRFTPLESIVKWMPRVP